MAANILQLPEPHTVVGEIYPIKVGTAMKLPFFLESISAGFPSPSDDYVEGRIDLNQELIHNPPATFFVRVAGNSMKSAGIHSGDTLIVDKSLNPCNGNIVIAVIDGEFTVKRLKCEGKRMFLQSDNSAYQPVEITESMETSIWGVVTTLIRTL